MTKRKLLTCIKCSLNNTCSPEQNNVAGWGNPKAKLVILLDNPGNALAEKLLIWICYCLNLTADDIWVDYVFKCGIPSGIKYKKDVLQHSYGVCWNHILRLEAINSKALVVAGNWGCQFVAKGKMKELHGRKSPETDVWVIYDFKYLLMNPAECVDAWRVLFKAAEEAGLKPLMNLEIEPFRFPSKKVR